MAKRAVVRDATLRVGDPVTTEREYTTSELEFLQAVDAYRVRHGKTFVTPVECLHILTHLGYAQIGLMA